MEKVGVCEVCTMVLEGGDVYLVPSIAFDDGLRDMGKFVPL